MGEWINGKWNSDATLAAKAAARAKPVRVISATQLSGEPSPEERVVRFVFGLPWRILDWFFNLTYPIMKFGSDLNPLSAQQAHWWYAARDGSCGGRCGLCNGEAGWGQQYAAHGYYPSRNQPNSGGVNAFDANGY